MAYHTPAGRPARATSAAELRLTHADRDAVAEQLKEAYALGRLDEEELDHRLDLAMRAKTNTDIQPLLGDLRAPHTAPPATTGGDGELLPVDRAWAAGGHVSGYFTLCLGPLLALLVRGRSSAFVRHHAMEALNYQLTFLVFSILLIPIAIVTLGLGAVAYGLFVVGWVFLPLIAAGAAAIGAKWRYPFTWRAVKER